MTGTENAMVDEDLRRVRMAVAEVERYVDTLAAHWGPSLPVRRLRTDVRRVGEDLDQLGEPPAAMASLRPQAKLEVVPDSEYEPGFWTDCDDEGLGHR